VVLASWRFLTLRRVQCISSLGTPMFQLLVLAEPNDSAPECTALSCLRAVLAWFVVQLGEPRLGS
jgi:hypothetical protein